MTFFAARVRSKKCFASSAGIGDSVTGRVGETSENHGGRRKFSAANSVDNTRVENQCFHRDGFYGNDAALSFRIASNPRP